VSLKKRLFYRDEHHYHAFLKEISIYVSEALWYMEYP